MKKVKAARQRGVSEAQVKAARKRLRGILKRFVKPLEPVIPPEEWDVNRRSR